MSDPQLRTSPIADVEQGNQSYHEEHHKKKKKKKRNMKEQHPTLFAKYWDLYVVGGFPYYLIAFCLSVCGYALRGIILGNKNGESCSVNLPGYLGQIAINAAVYAVLIAAKTYFGEEEKDNEAHKDFNIASSKNKNRVAKLENIIKAVKVLLIANLIWQMALGIFGQINLGGTFSSTKTLDCSTAGVADELYSHALPLSRLSNWALITLIIFLITWCFILCANFRR